MGPLIQKLGFRIQSANYIEIILHLFSTSTKMQGGNNKNGTVKEIMDSLSVFAKFCFKLLLCGAYKNYFIKKILNKEMDSKSLSSFLKGMQALEFKISPDSTILPNPHFVVFS